MGATSRVVVAFATAAALACTTAAAPPKGSPSTDGKDPLSAEIAHWSAVLAAIDSKDDSWAQAKQAGEPVLAMALRALEDGRRILALHRLGQARVNLAAAAYVAEHPAERTDAAKLEAEGARLGKALAHELDSPRAATFAGLRPAAVRAQAETALPQVRGFYEASLDYGRATTPEYGLFYLGSAQAQHDFVAFCRKLGATSPLREPRLRSIAAELEALEGTLLEAYRPPASIDRHGEFIVVSSTINEAKELDAAGLRYGALLRYLQALVRIAPLRSSPPVPLASDVLGERLREIGARLSSGAIDHSVARLFLELAETDLASPSQGAQGTIADTIVRDVFPRYFEALEPARRAARRPAPQATVTLVRWPYT